jgi:hypothetical protein|tara:strand:+ start:200 stop:424 length:225 start_codon:yes stop_codon:yes gene_type:complete
VTEYIYTWSRPVTQDYSFWSDKIFSTAEEVIREAQRLEEEGEIDPDIHDGYGPGDCFCGNDELTDDPLNHPANS